MSRRLDKPKLSKDVVPTTHLAAVPFPYRYASRSQAHCCATGNSPLQLEMLDKAMRAQFAWVLEALLRASSQLTDREQTLMWREPK